MSSPFRKGYSPFNGEPNQYHGWITLQRSLMYEDGLGKIMSGLETAPAAPEEDATQVQRAQFAKESGRFEEKNGKLFSRMLLATADCREGYASVAAQVVQAYAPIGTAEFGDGRGAVMALEAKYRLDGESRMRELHDQLANLNVTVADKYDPARVIQELRRICVELGALGDVVFPARKTHAFFRALPDEKYESLKTVMLCDRQRDGSASNFDDIAARATSYHAMQIRDKVTAKEERAGRDEHDAGSRECALNTTAYDGSRNSSRRRNNGRDGREHRINGTSNTNSPARRNNNNGGYTSTNSNGNLSEDSNSSRPEGARERRHSNHAGRGGRERNRNDGKNRHGRCNYCRNSTVHGWHDCPLRLSHQQNDDAYHANAAQVSSQRETITHAWCTQAQTANLESFGSCIDDGGKRGRLASVHVPVQKAPEVAKQDELAAAVCKPQAPQEYFETAPTFPAMLEISSDKLTGNAIIIDTAASHHMVPAESQLCQHVVNKTDCCMRIKGSCGLTTARTKGTLAFRVRNDGGELVPIHLEVIIVPNLGASVFSVGALHEKGVKLDLMANPPVLRDGNSAFPVSTEYPRMFVLRILLNGQEKPRDDMLSHTAVETDSWHRRMGPCRPHALKQLAEELTAGADYFIDSSGVGMTSGTGNTPGQLQTDETVDSGSAELVTDTGIYENVNAGTFISTQEFTTRATSETYGIAGTCPTDSPAEGSPVDIAEDPILSTEDTAGKPILSTENTAEEPSMSTEDTTILRPATGSLPYLNRCATMELSFSEDAEDGKGCSATRVVANLVAAGAPPVD